MKLVVTSCSSCRWFVRASKMCRCLTSNIPFGTTPEEAKALFADPIHGLTEIRLPITDVSKPPVWCLLRMGPVTVELVFDGSIENDN